MSTRIGKYTWEIDPNEMPMDELKCLKEYLDDMFEIRERDKKVWLNRMYNLIDEAREAGFQFTMFTPCTWTNLTAYKENINIDIKEEWV